LAGSIRSYCGGLRSDELLKSVLAARNLHVVALNQLSSLFNGFRGTVTLVVLNQADRVFVISLM
jgi:hypothetical protein